MNDKIVIIDYALSQLNSGVKPIEAFSNILSFAETKFNSKIWRTFSTMNFEKDISDTLIWLNENIANFPNPKGIYLGLDSLNMNEGEGSNLVIGLTYNCNPEDIDSAWIYNCEFYGGDHLIRGLYDVSSSFFDKESWSNQERDYAEYVIFVSYSGLILKDALLQLKGIMGDYISIWGFHDGDMFYLIQKIGNKINIITEIDM